MLVIVLLSLILLFVLTPLACGLISDHGPEWVMYPNMYLSIYLLLPISNFGINIRQAALKMLRK